MEIHALKVSLTEQDLNDLLGKHLPANQPIEELNVRVSPQGLSISGVYPLFINVHFVTQWQLGLDRGQVTARLESFKAMGVPGNIFKSAIIKVIEDVAQAEKWVRIKGDTIWVDVDACIAKYAFPAQTCLRHLECQSGRIILEGSADMRT
jgi:hypothetical protein